MSRFSFRPFVGPADYPAMLAGRPGSQAADDSDDADTLEGLTERYARMTHCDPATDMVMLLGDGRLTGYGRAFWEKDSESSKEGFCDVGTHC